MTAEHSRRVADLCVLLGTRVMSVRDTYVLEMAALLHDIGKIGLPDAILCKPSPLTEDEWKIMGMHDHIGVDIVGSTFASPALMEIIPFAGAFHPHQTVLPAVSNVCGGSFASRVAF